LLIVVFVFSQYRRQQRQPQTATTTMTTTMTMSKNNNVVVLVYECVVFSKKSFLFKKPPLFVNELFLRNLFPLFHHHSLSFLLTFLFMSFVLTQKHRNKKLFIKDIDVNTAALFT